jgi:hypothetical protein
MPKQIAEAQSFISQSSSLSVRIGKITIDKLEPVRDSAIPKEGASINSLVAPQNLTLAQ